MENQIVSQTKNLENPTALSWVYILFNLKTREMNIALSFNLLNRFSNFDTAQKLVYCRNFSNPFDSLAHKFLLGNISVESVMHNIKQENPTLRDLSLQAAFFNLCRVAV
ncbi:MAG: hypothetical protein PHD00_10410 [Bacteroidales bacterium]|nr:hypothetical protein [Bacteroidales bacterium]MDD4671399.1 hypothetical protein [Bacteroidales bacterium]MDY0347716.1 hypothetical protein [Tenuifilaceae bacterium]